MNIVVPALTATLMALVAPEVGPIEGRERYPFAMSVSSGPVGTLIEMKSTSPCPPPPPGERPYVLVNFLPPDRPRDAAHDYGMVPRGRGRLMDRFGHR